MRPTPVVLALLREALPGVSVVSVVPDVDHRTLPMVSVRRAGGKRNPKLPRQHALPVIELEAVSADGLPDAEQLYEAVLDALYDAVRYQTVIPNLGHLQSISELQGATQKRSDLPDTWSVIGQLRLAIRSD